MYCSSVVAGRAVVARLERWIGTADVTVDAPSHVQRVLLIYLLHVLDLAVARLTRHPRIHVSHVREVNVLGKLVNPDPWNWLLAVPVSGEELRAWLGGRHNGVAAHAGADRRQAWIRRFRSREVAIDAVHLERSSVHGVRKRDGLRGTVALRRRSSGISREHGGGSSDGEETRNSEPFPLRFHLQLGT